MVIREDTSIEKLRDAGILPEFIYRDCEEHGMYEAENVLNEWDWEWDWDLGDGYNSEQLDILEKVRKTISDGIKAFHSNPIEVQRYKDERERKRKRENMVERYRKKFYGIVFQNWIEWLVDYELRHNELPYFFFMCTKFVWWTNKLTIRHKARLLLAGIGVENPMSIEEVCKRVPELNKRQVKNLSKHPFPLKGKFADFVTKLHTQLPKRPLIAEDDFWNELIERQSLYKIQPLQLMRMVALVREDYELTQDGDIPILIHKLVLG